MRRRVQRQLANQMDATSWAIEMMQMKTREGQTPVLVQLAHSTVEHAVSEGTRVIASKSVTLEMPCVSQTFVAPHVEREMGCHFEVTPRFLGQS